MISCANIARLIRKGWRLEVVQDTLRADHYHARVVHPTDRLESHHHLGETMLQAIDSLDAYVGVVAPEPTPGKSDDACACKTECAGPDTTAKRCRAEDGTL
jgi:hypothetical protein